MSNYLKIIFKCDFFCKYFFHILGGGGPFLEGTEVYKNWSLSSNFKLLLNRSSILMLEGHEELISKIVMSISTGCEN